MSAAKPSHSPARQHKLLPLLVAGLFALALAAPSLASASAPLAPVNTAHWTQDAVNHSNLFSIDCFSTTECLAGDSSGNAIFSSNPTAEANATWSSVSIGGGSGTVGGISCATASFCAVVKGGSVVTTEDATDGASSSWTVIPALQEQSLTAISCPSTTLCVAVSGEGTVFTSTDPTDGVSSVWTSAALSDGGEAAISCPTGGLCLIGDGAGNVFTSTDPSADSGSGPGSGATWAKKNAGGSRVIVSISCPATQDLCVAIDNNEEAFTTTDPLDGASATWQAENIGSSFFLSRLSCPSTALCVAVGPEGVVAITTDPADGGSATWVHNYLAASVYGVSCPTVTFCAASGSTRLQFTAPPFTDTSGAIWTANPTDFLPSISGKTVDGQPLTGSQGQWGNSPLFLPPPIPAGTDAPAIPSPTSANYTYAYQWQLCDSSGNNCANILGATSKTYTLVDADIGSTLVLIVTATNGSGGGGNDGGITGTSTSAASQHSAIVTALAPSAPSVPTITGTPITGDTLTSSAGTGSEGLPIPGYSYQWQLCDGSGNNCANISGATGLTLALTSGDVGKTARMVVTASNVGGSASTSSAATLVISAPNVAPPTTLIPTPGPVLSDLSLTPFVLHKCSPHGHPCHQKTIQVSFVYTGPKATLRIKIYRQADEKGHKLGPRKLVLTTFTVVSTGGYRLVPRRFDLTPGTYTVVAEAFVVLGGPHSTVLEQTIQVGPSKNHPLP